MCRYSKEHRICEHPVAPPGPFAYGENTVRHPVYGWITHWQYEELKKREAKRGVTIPDWDETLEKKDEADV